MIAGILTLLLGFGLFTGGFIHAAQAGDQADGGAADDGSADHQSADHQAAGSAGRVSLGLILSGVASVVVAMILMGVHSAMACSRVPRACSERYIGSAALGLLASR